MKFDYYENLVSIIILTLCILFVVFILNIYYLKQYFLNNFEKYRCQYWFWPLVTWINPNISGAENFNFCVQSKNKQYFKTVSKPLDIQTNLLYEQLRDQLNSIQQVNDGSNTITQTTIQKRNESNNNLRHMEYLQTYMLLKFRGIGDKLIGSLMNIYYSFLSQMEFVKIILAIPDLVHVILKSTTIIMASVIGALIILIATTEKLITALTGALIGTAATGVLGGIAVALGTAIATLSSLLSSTYVPALALSTLFTTLWTALFLKIESQYVEADKHSYCCFLANTLINQKLIYNYQIGETIDKLQQNYIVGILTCKVLETDIFYKINHTFTTHNHLIWDQHSNHYIPVSEYIKIHQLQSQCYHYSELDNQEKANSNYLYCFNTSNNQIITDDGNIYADYQETPSLSYEQFTLASNILFQLNSHHQDNKNNIQQKYEYGESILGFNQSTYLLLSDHTIKRISDIEIGDQLYSNNKVIGIYQCIQPPIICQLSNMVTCSPHQIIYHTTDQKYYKCYELYKPELTTKINNFILSHYYYHLVTERGYFYVTNILSSNDNLNNSFIQCKDYVQNGTLLVK